jgi:hypothetical protein
MLTGALVRPGRRGRAAGEGSLGSAGPEPAANV